MQPSAARPSHAYLAALACLLSLCSGCSWLFVTEAPKKPEQLRYFECTSSRAAPVLDSVAAVIYGVTGAAAATTDAFPKTDRPMYTAVYAVTAAIDIASAVYGYKETSRCGDAKDELALRLEREQEREHEKPFPQAAPGCTTDIQCKGDRICVDSLCVYPASTLTPPPLPSAAPQPPPPSEPLPSAAPAP